MKFTHSFNILFSARTVLQLRSERTMSSSDDEVVVNQPKSKSGSLGGKRTNKKPRSSPSDSSEDSGAGSSKQPAKKQKLAKKTITNDDGSEMHEIGNNRFISVSMFKGKVFVNIREYYEKDGKLLPGKKGISLTQDQYLKMKKALSAIDETLES